MHRQASLGLSLSSEIAAYLRLRPVSISVLVASTSRAGALRYAGRISLARRASVNLGLCGVAPRNLLSPAEVHEPLYMQSAATIEVVRGSQEN